MLCAFAPVSDLRLADAHAQVERESGDCEMHRDAELL